MSRELLWLSAAGIFLSSLDDLAVDAVWLARVAFRPEEPQHETVDTDHRE
jgi:hypothetical protein